jgi:alkaline phosphatase D
MKSAFLIFGIFCFLSRISAQGNLDVDTCLYPFYHGIASGDPMEDRVIIWTRVTPDSLTGGPVLVSWKMATDTGMTNIVNQGSVITNSLKDYTVKVDVTGLQPKNYYYYEFSALGYRSAVGRTKTAPSSIYVDDSVRFGLVSCANLEAGYFNVYKVLVERNDVDAIICLGDYIYEYGTGGYSPNPSTQRFWEPDNEIITLSDYRMRYSTYRLDGDLRRAHQLFPWICIWDDHESANDSWTSGAENHTEGAEGIWMNRKNFSKQAYFEWLPVRETGTTDPYQIYRSIHYGPLCDLVMLDTRLHGRDEQSGTSGSTVNSEFREMLGQNQRDWMQDELLASTAQWKILVQQVMVAPLEVAGFGVNGDQWDGYPAERDRLYDFITANDVENIVVVTGDIHSSWANDLPGGSYNSSTGSGSFGVEFVTPSVTSPGFPIGVGASVIQAANPHMKFVDLSQHGFIILDINQTRAQADWYFVSTIDSHSSAHAHGSSWYVNDDTKHLQSSLGAAIPSDALTESIVPEICPRVTADPIDETGIRENDITVLSVYPNPAENFFNIQYFLREPGLVKLSILSIDGAIISSFETEKSAGVWVERYPLENLAVGVYLIQITSSNYSKTLRLVVE